jgi:hypothetical protein
MQVALVLGGPEPLLLVKRHSRTLGQAGELFLAGVFPRDFAGRSIETVLSKT